MSDRETIRCKNPRCRGRWIAKVRRTRDGTAVVVEYRRTPRTSAYDGPVPRTDVDREAILRQLAEEDGERSGWGVEIAPILIAEGLITYADVNERVGSDLQLRCSKCGAITVVPPAL